MKHYFLVSCLRKFKTYSSWPPTGFQIKQFGFEPKPEMLIIEVTLLTIVYYLNQILT